VQEAEDRMLELAAAGRGRYEPLGCGKEWSIRNPLVATSDEQSNVVRHVLESPDFVISFRGPAGAEKRN
jgi:hypothetical protein